nr:hypothetical protein [Haliscomenobacter sp.]
MQSRTPVAARVGDVGARRDIEHGHLIGVQAGRGNQGRIFLRNQLPAIDIGTVIQKQLGQFDCFCIAVFSGEYPVTNPVEGMGFGGIVGIISDAFVGQFRIVFQQHVDASVVQGFEEVIHREYFFCKTTKNL